MKVLITGASGFLGYHLTRFLETNAEVTACFHSRPVSFSQAVAERLDFTDPGECSTVLNRHSPTHIIHAGAMALVADCEKYPGQAERVNVQGTRNIVSAAAGLSSQPHLVYISTDLVFDGNTGNYTETDDPNPLNVYARTKLQSERVVASYPGPWTIVRGALMFGPLDAARPSFVNWMLGMIRTGTGTLFTDEYRTPVYVQDVCRFVELCLRKAATGIFHCGGGEKYSRYEFGHMLADVFGVPQANVFGAASVQVAVASKRPADVSLDITKAREQLGYQPLPCREALEEIRSFSTGEN